MSEKPLLLSSTRAHAAVERTSTDKKWLLVMAAIGLLVVLVGAADVSSRIGRAFFGDKAGLIAFAPAVTLTNPAIQSSFFGTGIASTTPVVPIRLKIPSIGVDALVEDVGKKADGTMGTPANFDDVAWYSLGQKPGAVGNAVIDGHVNNALTKAGVFQHLNALSIGDTVLVADAAGRTLTYKVSQVSEYAVGGAPTGAIFASTGPSQLVLITCDGKWVASAKSFDKRLVVFASLQ